jgi:hypothetical protein
MATQTKSHIERRGYPVHSLSHKHKISYNFKKKIPTKIQVYYLHRMRILASARLAPIGSKRKNGARLSRTKRRTEKAKVSEQAFLSASTWL